MESSQGQGNESSSKREARSQVGPDPIPIDQYLVAVNLQQLSFGVVVGFVIASLLNRCGCDRPKC